MNAIIDTIEGSALHLNRVKGVEDQAARQRPQVALETQLGHVKGEIKQLQSRMKARNETLCQLNMQNAEVEALVRKMKKAKTEAANLQNKLRGELNLKIDAANSSKLNIQANEGIALRQQDARSKMATDSIMSGPSMAAANNTEKLKVIKTKIRAKKKSLETRQAGSSSNLIEGPGYTVSMSQVLDASNDVTRKAMLETGMTEDVTLTP